jgi:3-oxoacyl-[acyl-carrier protein] reductase
MSDGCALVTGGSRGIGAACAKALAEAGWPVGVNFRSDEAGAGAVVEEIVASGGQAIAVRGDVSAPDDLNGTFDLLEERFGPVLVLVNNAGVTGDNLAIALGDDEWERVIDTNLTGAFRTTRRALRPMIKARFGRVVNISSVSAIRAIPGQANYAASKAGLIAMTQTVAIEVARRGVTVNAVAPGMIATDMTEGVDDGVARMIPARRIGDVDDVAACVRFLASREAGYVTGALLCVDGGMSAQALFN